MAVFLLSLHYFFAIGGLHVITNHESVQPSVAQTTYHHTYQIELAGKAFAARPTRQLQISGRAAQKGKTLSEGRKQSVSISLRKLLCI